MDTLLSDEDIPDEGIDRQCATALQKQLIEFWTGMHRFYLATGKSIYKLPQRITGSCKQFSGKATSPWFLRK